jgi:hypothetical protein
MNYFDPVPRRLVLSWANGDPVVLTIPPWCWGEVVYGLRRLYRWFPSEGVRHDLFINQASNQVVAFYVENTRRNWLADLGGYHNMLEHLRKAAGKALSAPGEMEVTDEKFAADFPALFCFLSANVDGEGELRERCKIQIFAEGGSWKCCLMDAGMEASIFVTLKVPGDAFKALEKALSVDKPDWRRWRLKRKK